jgi:hypothetical protein
LPRECVYRALPRNGGPLENRCLATGLYTFLPPYGYFFPNNLQAYRHFFSSEGCACDVCLQTT